MLGLLTLIQADDDDLLTMLWEQDFTCLQYRYVDLATEGGMPLETCRGEKPVRVASTREIEGEAQVLVLSTLARMEEYDSTLYFLDDGEIDYLQSEIRKDFSTDMRTHVIASLLIRMRGKSRCVSASWSSGSPVSSSSSTPCGFDST